MNTMPWKAAGKAVTIPTTGYISPVYTLIVRVASSGFTQKRSAIDLEATLGMDPHQRRVLNNIFVQSFHIRGTPAVVLECSKDHFNFRFSKSGEETADSLLRLHCIVSQHLGKLQIGQGFARFDTTSYFRLSLVSLAIFLQLALTFFSAVFPRLGRIVLWFCT